MIDKDQFPTADKLVESAQGFFEMLSRNTRGLPMIKRKKQGGQAPYGYRWLEGRLTIDPEEARVRGRAFELFLEHRRKGTVARILNEEGRRPRRGSLWRDVTVGRLLACSSARGLYVINKTTVDGSGNRVPRPEDEWETIECEAIVTEELWDEVNAILEGQARKSNRPARQGAHTFSGLAICGDCGAKMVVPTSNSGKYVCPTSRCERKIAVSDLEGVFQDELAEYLRERGEVLEEILGGDPDLADRKRLLAEHLREIENLEAEISKNHHLYLKNQISTERFSRHHQPLEDRLKLLKSEAVGLESEINRLTQNAPDSDPGDELDIRKLAGNWPKLPMKSRRQIARLLVDKLIIGDGEIEIAYKFAQPPAPRDHVPTFPQQTGIPPESTPSLKDATISQQTGRPTFAPSATTTDEPIYIRLPKAGELCPRTGMGRSVLNELILPTERNDYKPPVKSKSLRRTGNIRGVRLILWESLREYLGNQ